MVLLDAVMPGMDGFEVCQWLREQPDGKRCPCLMITGLNHDASVDLGTPLVPPDFIPKPIHWAVLRQRVRLLLQASRREYHLAYHKLLQRWRAVYRVCGKRYRCTWVRMNSSYCSTAYSPRIVSIRSPQVLEALQPAPISTA